MKTPNYAEKVPQRFKLPTKVKVCKSTGMDQIIYLGREMYEAAELYDDAPKIKGEAGWALDGVPMYGPDDNEANAEGGTGRNAISFEGYSFTPCSAHVDNRQLMHYHGHPGIHPTGCNKTCSSDTTEGALLCNALGVLCDDTLPAAPVCPEVGVSGFHSSTAQGNAAFGGPSGVVHGSNGHSFILGIMADGIPLYGLYGADGLEPDDLDTCNGHVSDLGFYHYHATRAYPYLTMCLRGILDSSISQDDRMLNQGRSGEQSNMAYANSYGRCTSGYDTYDYSEILSNWTYGNPDYGNSLGAAPVSGTAPNAGGSANSPSAALAPTAGPTASPTPALRRRLRTPGAP